jgi:hypothetical protein
MTRPLAIAALLLAALPLSPSAQSDVISLASVTSDGMLVPFAVYDGKNWLTPWPEPGSSAVDSIENPTAEQLEALPTFWKTKGLQVPKVWRLWLSDGTGPSHISVLKRVGYEAGCERQAGLVTDFKHEPNLHLTRYLASDGPVSIEHPIDLRTAETRAAGWEDVVEAIMKAFPLHEERAIAEWRKGGAAFNLSRTARLAQPIQLRKLYAHRDGRRRVVFFEGVREYNVPLSEPGCNGKTFFSGWAISDNGAAPVIRGGPAVVTDCDEMETTRAVPLGVIRGVADGLWILNNQYYESDALSIVSVGRTIRELLQTHGGGC